MVNDEHEQEEEEVAYVNVWLFVELTSLRFTFITKQEMLL